MQLELPFINSYIGTSKLDFTLVLISMILLIKLSNYKKYLAIIPLIFTLNYNNIAIPNPDIKIAMANINIPQQEKWDQKFINKIININLDSINNAIKNKYELIILPETAFPLVLNKHIDLLNILKEKSKQISILTGALHQEGNFYHNSTYLFQNNSIQVAHKVVLIPFGEAIPLPALLRDIINDTFYNGAKDYEPALEVSDFKINGINFRNAICYEATTSKIFKNLQDKYIIAISNNAWFTPSIQPTLQNLLLKFYAKKYNVKIFSSTNGSINHIIN